MFHIPFTYLFTSDFTPITLSRIGGETTPWAKRDPPRLSLMPDKHVSLQESRGGRRLFQYLEVGCQRRQERRNPTGVKWWNFDALGILGDDKFPGWKRCLKTGKQTYSIQYIYIWEFPLFCCRHSCWLLVTTKVMVGYGWVMLIPLLWS